MRQNLNYVLSLLFYGFFFLRIISRRQIYSLHNLKILNSLFFNPRDYTHVNRLTTISLNIYRRKDGHGWWSVVVWNTKGESSRRMGRDGCEKRQDREWGREGEGSFSRIIRGPKYRALRTRAGPSLCSCRSSRIDKNRVTFCATYATFRINISRTCTI